MGVRKEVKRRCKKIRQENCLKMTEAEKKFKNYLDENNIKHEAQYPIYSKSSFILVDFCLLDFNIAIEIDGGSHKGRLKSWQSYNAWRERLIKKQGLVLKRFWNEDILENSDNFRKLKEEMLNVL